MIVDIQLTGETYGGDCVARMPDGRALFIPFGISGEKVRVEITEEKKNYVRGKIIKVLDPSPLRINPRCQHFIDCGGCHYQHLAYAEQLKLKQRILKQQLERLGKIPEPPVNQIVPSPLEWNYRNTVQFHLFPTGKPGFQRAGSNRVVEISECHLPLPVINTLWPQLEIDPQAGIERLSIRSGVEDELLLELEGTTPTPPEFEVDFPLSVVYQGPEENMILSGEDFSIVKVLDREFKVSAESFFQVNTAVAEKMVKHVLDSVSMKYTHIIDAYCGAGLFSAFLAPRCDQLTGIEISESACDDFAANLEEFEHVSLYMGKVEQVLPSLDVSPDLVLLDPPRAGLDPRAMEGLLKAAPAQIVYVSCDPATLARDLRKMIDSGYHLESITPFDMFPQTFHVETITVLKRKR